MPTFTKPTPAQLADRFASHEVTMDQAMRMDRIRQSILDTAVLAVDLTPVSPEQARALNALDEAMFLFNAAIARNEEYQVPGPQIPGTPGS